MLASLSRSHASLLGVVLDSPKSFGSTLIFHHLPNDKRLFRSIERQMAVHAEAEKELQSRIDSLQDQLQAAHEQADRKQIVVDNLSEVGNTPCLKKLNSPAIESHTCRLRRP